jgi:hypothetical protein
LSSLATHPPRRHRRSRPTSTADVGQANDRPNYFDVAVEGLVYALLAFSPLAFGVVAAWSREVFLLLVSAAALVVVTKHAVGAWAGRTDRYPWSWAHPLMLAFLALCAFQTVPLPATWVSRFSPETVRLKAELLRDLPEAADVLRRVTLTFYTHATVGQVVLVAAVCAIFAVVLDVFREPARIRRLLAVVVIVGFVVAGLAAYQDLTGATTVYGVVPMQGSHRHIGPFMNYSHFSQFTNMSVGAALALLLDRLAHLAGRHGSLHQVSAALRQPRHWMAWVCVALGILGPLMVLLSLSRMGMLSLFATTIFSGAMLVWRGRATALAAVAGGMTWMLAGLGLLVFAALLYVGFDEVSARLATVPTAESTDTRTEVLRSLLPEFRQFPLVGMGLGTHEFVFGLYDHRTFRKWASMADHAENEYAQLMEETGVAGTLLAAGFVATMVVNYLRATRRPTESIGYVPFGLGFGLLAILIHSGSDFGQHLPANAALTATFAALLTTLARRRGVTVAEARPGIPVRRPLSAAARWVALAGVTVAAVGVCLWADRARAAESLWCLGQAHANELTEHQWQGSQSDYASILTPAAAAVRLEPGDVEYRFWTDVYRWCALSHTTDPVTGKDVLPPGGEVDAGRIADDLDAVRVLCPTYGLPLSIVGQIDRDVLGRVDRGRWEIRTSYRLTPYSPGICMIAALDALARHSADEAEAGFRHYIALGGPMGDVDDVCVHAGQPLIPFRMVRDDRGEMNALADRMPATDPRWAAWIAKCREVAAKLLVADAARPDAPPDVLAELAASEQQQGHAARAVDLYQRAVSADFGNVDWHVRLAGSLAGLRRYAEAAHELNVCLRLQPAMPGASDLLADYEAKAAGTPATAP